MHNRVIEDAVHAARNTQVGFLHGADGNPWVWVMGDHSSDLSYEELVKKREQEELRKEKLNDMQDRKEAEEIAKLDVLDLSASFSALGE